MTPSEITIAGEIGARRDPLRSQIALSQNPRRKLGPFLHYLRRVVVAVVIMVTMIAACKRETSVRMHEEVRVGDLIYRIERKTIENPPPRIDPLRPSCSDYTYVVISYELVNAGDVSVIVGIPAFELCTADGRRFRPDFVGTLYYQSKRASEAQSLASIADSLNSQLHPGLRGNYSAVFYIPRYLTMQKLSLTIRSGWLILEESTLTLD